MSNDRERLSTRSRRRPRAHPGRGVGKWCWASLGLALACASGQTTNGAFVPLADDVTNCARELSASMAFDDAPRDHPLGATVDARRVNLLRWAPEGPWQRAITIDWIAVSVYFVGDSGRARAEAATQRRPRTEWDPAPPDVRALADSIQRHCRFALKVN
jgi:hypothetical protein